MVIAFGGCAAALLLLHRAGGQAAPSLTRGRPTRCTGITSATLCIADVRWHLRTWPHAAFLLSRRPVHRTHGQVIGVEPSPTAPPCSPCHPLAIRWWTGTCAAAEGRSRLVRVHPLLHPGRRGRRWHDRRAAGRTGPGRDPRHRRRACAAGRARPGPRSGRRPDEPAHWEGLPDGASRRTTTRDDLPASVPHTSADDVEPGDPPVLLERAGLAVPVARRDQRVYDQAAGLTGVGGAA